MTFHCDNCGAELAPKFKTARMVTCDYCDTTAVLIDDAFRSAGKSGVMADAPGLVALGQPVLVDGKRLDPVGHIRFDYGRGWWDEYWCLDVDGDGVWLSVDEGDCAFERPLPRDAWPEHFQPRLGAKLYLDDQEYTVTEAESATCIAVSGSLPEVITVGEVHLYYDITGEYGGIVTYEKWDEGEAWFRGTGVDPWKVERL